ncbi:HET-domain-containing protein [Periconia macrospinosa]|uniref:HET-domain-containing protein n=1 Tax=Periconia macrospinosa TaxID=97972 RepID=A0A2V1D4C3_9PLEO|nr:HET-domain-containing protein [Periconia macrospinosa]
MIGMLGLNYTAQQPGYIIAQNEDGRRVLQDNDQFSLVEFVGNNIPPYAILSHTWGSKDDEVFFQDIKNDVGKEKPGYQKIRFCGKQAKDDDLAFIWVDTCCIDKTSSAELSEAINSMFQWYQNAKICYAYLSDVSNKISGDENQSVQRQKLALQRSRWFTRGWTLQELLAPASVEFFSKDWERLGSKQYLKQTIHEITKVPLEVLEGAPVSRYSVEERFSWASNRQTTRVEDESYCLLGIFDIHMPLIYGEGKEKALKRLQKEVRESQVETAATLSQNIKANKPARAASLSKIRRWLAAPDPSVNYQNALKQRQQDTGLWFLESEPYTNWRVDAASFIWLYGIPGCGKTILSSTILQDILQHCDIKLGQVAVYFYFDFNDVQKQHADPMLRSLVCQLLQQSVEIPTDLDTLSSHDDGRRQPSLDSLLDATRQMMQKASQVYILLDALDECTQRAELMEVLRVIAGWQLKNVHIIMTSREEQDIKNYLEQIVEPRNSICFESEVVNKDIQQYVRERLSGDNALNKWSKDITLRHKIETALIEGSKGMLYTYNRILCAIAEDDFDNAIRILQWLAFSGRPLSVEKVAEVIAINRTRDPAFDRNKVLEDPLEALDIYSSLISIRGVGDDSGKQVAVLAHYSVKDYLMLDRIQKGQAARYWMQGTVCHSIISHAYVNAQGKHYSNALYAALRGGYKVVVKLLLNAGANINA